MTSPALDAPAAPASTSLTRGHLHQVDIVRSLTFFAVVSVHAILATVVLSSGTVHGVVAGAVLMLMHVNREAFFALSTFVLFHSRWGKPLLARQFWRKRLGLIVVPYLVWTVVYLAVDAVLKPKPLGAELLYILHTVAFGHYQLYFLIVMMQVYLVFPALVWLVRRTAGHHALLLAISAAAQLMVLAVVHHYLINAATWFFGTYWFYLVAGALAAVHLDRLHVLLTSHRRLVVLAAVAAAVLAELVYFGSLATGETIGAASDPFSPVTIVWNSTAILALYLLGAAWARRRQPGRLATVVRHASEDSFGVYLVHALFLWPIIPALPLLGSVSLPLPFQTIYLIVLTLVFSVGFVEIAFRTPLSRQLVGRARRTRQRVKRAGPPAVQPDPTEPAAAPHAVPQSTGGRP